MSGHYSSIAFTDDVREAQRQHGSDGFYDRKRRSHLPAGPDPLTDREAEFLKGRDGFYLATVGATGWPYVQFRGGPTGFVRILDEHRIGWADLRGNLQYISTGNLAGDDRVAIIAVDYARRTRLKLFGRTRVIGADEEPGLTARLRVDGYDAVVERAVVVTVEAFDWNCPQHITPRFSEAELEPMLDSVRRRIADLEAENAALRSAAASRDR